MNNSESVTIVRERGCSITGQVINHKTKKLGNFEVHSDRYATERQTFAKYSEAESRFKALVAKAEKDGHGE